MSPGIRQISRPAILDAHSKSKVDFFSTNKQCVLKNKSHFEFPYKGTKIHVRVPH